MPVHSRSPWNIRVQNHYRDAQNKIFESNDTKTNMITEREKTDQKAKRQEEYNTMQEKKQLDLIMKATKTGVFESMVKSRDKRVEEAESKKFNKNKKRPRRLNESIYERVCQAWDKEFKQSKKLLKIQDKIKKKQERGDNGSPSPETKSGRGSSFSKAARYSSTHYSDNDSEEKDDDEEQSAMRPVMIISQGSAVVKNTDRLSLKKLWEK